MDDPNVTMEEYIQLEEEKARRLGQMYNWRLLCMVRSDKDNDNDKIDIKQPSGDIFVISSPNVINTDVDAYVQGSNK
ncbi:hypothetical protein Tco_0048053, partial [Tanacetum coccineum]